MRSGYEQKVAAYLKEQGCSFEYEPYSVLYFSTVRSGRCSVCGGTSVEKERWYKPDFVLENGIIIEAKGKFTGHNRTSMIALLNTCEHINRDNFRLLFMRNNKIGKKTYVQWAEFNNIICHVSEKGEVPEEWMK